MRADDILDDHDLDRALHDLLAEEPTMPRWERRQRDRLLIYIETGEIDTVRDLDEGPEQIEAEPFTRVDGRSTPMSRHRMLALGGVAAAVILLVVGLVVTQRPGVPAPVQSPTDQPAERPTGSVGEGTVDDTVDAQTDAAAPGDTVVGVADAELDAPAATTSFTPLAPVPPPAGYDLAGVERADAGYPMGVARYSADTTTTELWLSVRDTPDFFDQVRLLDRRSWEVDGRTVWSDGELDGCLPDVCSIGVQWDEHTALSLQWVEPNGGTLAPDHDQESLMALLPTLAPDPSAWDTATVPTFDATVSDNPVTLLAPTAETQVDSANAFVVGPPGSMSAVLRAPDGSIQNLNLVRNPEPVGELPAGGHPRSFGQLDATGNFDSQIDTYRASHGCWTLQLADGGGTGDAEPWRSEVTSLFAAMQVGDTWLELHVPADWSNLSFDKPSAAFEVVIPVGTTGKSVTVTQSPSSGVAYAAALAAHDTEVAPFVAGEALVGTVGADPMTTTVYWSHEGVYSTATASGLSVDQIAEVVGEMRSITQVQWEDRFGPIVEQETGTGSCPPVTLSLTAP